MFMWEMGTSFELTPQDQMTLSTALSQEMIAQSEEEIVISGYLMTQYSLKAGMCKFGEQAKDVAMTELTQLHVMDTWQPEDPRKLSRVEKVSALLSLMFFKKKRDRKFKKPTLHQWELA